jgi:hypothetical protein
MGNELSTIVSVEQLRTLSEKIRQAKAGAIGAMKEAIEAMHEQGALLVQAEMELGSAFDGWVDGLADDGIDPMQARYCMKVAKKHKDIKSLFANPGAAKQMVLQNFAPPAPPKPETEVAGSVAPYTISLRFNLDPMDAAFPRAKFLADPLVRSVVQTAQELEGQARE